MTALQVRDFPQELHAELRRRARREGITLGEYVTRLLRREVEPTPGSWLEELAADEPVDLRPGTVADRVRADRDAREEELLGRVQRH
jgi:antitoxin FitA